MDQLSRVTSDGCWGPMAAASEAGIVPSHGLRQSHDQSAMRASSLARSASKSPTVQRLYEALPPLSPA